MLQMEMSNRSSLDQLHINLRWMKEWKRNSSERLAEGPLPYNTFWLTLSGSATMQFDKEVYEINKYSIIALHAQTFHRWISIGDKEPFHYLSLACEARVGSFDLLRMYRFPCHATLDDPASFEQLVALWYELSNEFYRLLSNFNGKDVNQADPLFVFNTSQTIQYLKIRSLGNLWIHQLFELLRQQLPESPVTYDIRVYEICDYIKEHLRERTTLEELAARASLSKEHLRFLFQKELGLSPMKYVTSIRLQKARELLLMTSNPMKDIAQRIGYDDQHHFTRAFHRAEGMSPSEYRKKYKGSIEFPPEMHGGS
ncbi:helix-turn-helix domain-containing protein [Paenibacillus spongiae]|uniref:AraC family transcriptional regulator n=1 Tax=Paenibacillus spongiae TaxID=2909671 RepID=A0ABY5SHI8_9BACL|nr:AraC family transcriptional regulator [Paenibacillus spongiae]UVI32930.1 AraC family transcriptional regulator [Paenibacillus spongiae]